MIQRYLIKIWPSSKLTVRPWQLYMIGRPQWNHYSNKGDFQGQTVNLPDIIYDYIWHYMRYWLILLKNSWQQKSLHQLASFLSGWILRAFWSTLWLCQNSYWKWPFIVDFPFNVVIFHSYVSLPEAIAKWNLAHTSCCKHVSSCAHRPSLHQLRWGKPPRRQCFWFFGPWWVASTKATSHIEQVMGSMTKQIRAEFKIIQRDPRKW